LVTDNFIISMENKELHPNIVIRRHIKSTAKAGKVIVDLMNDQIRWIDTLGTITERCINEHIQPIHAKRFFAKYIEKWKMGKTRAKFSQEILGKSSEISKIYQEILSLDIQDQKVIRAIVTNLFYSFPIWSSR
jgi:hypothetical protein